MSEDIKDLEYYQDWKTVLIPRIRETKAWSDLFDAISEVFTKNIYKYIYLLRFIRDPALQDKLTNIQQAKFLGFEYKSDLFDEVEYANLVYFLNYYNRKVKGTMDFVNFIGWIKNAKFKIHQLWADGINNYSDNPDAIDPFNRETYTVRNNSMVDGTGTQKWYPTSHVDMEYDAEAFHIDETDIWYLFYKCAPIHLVLRSISAVFTAELFNLNFNLAVNDYTNTHNCLPCFYRGNVPLNFSVGSGYNSISYNFLNAYYGYVKGNNVSYLEISAFDKQSIAEQFPTSLSFSRNSQATNLERGNSYLTIVPENYPRFTYLPLDQAPDTGFGLLVEERRTNLLLDSGNPSERRLFLTSGTYAFSGMGRYRIWNLTKNQSIGEVSNNSFVFCLDEDTQIEISVLYKPQHAWFQLELGKFSTSYIENSSLIRLPREADIVQGFNLPVTDKSGSFFISFSTNKISNECILLKVYEAANRYIEVKKSGNKIELNIKNENKIITYLTQDFNGEIDLSISRSKLIFNKEVIEFPLDNCPIPKYCNIGQDYGLQSINGYIQRFYYIPSFVNQ